MKIKVITNVNIKYIDPKTGKEEDLWFDPEECRKVSEFMAKKEEELKPMVIEFLRRMVKNQDFQE